MNLTEHSGARTNRLGEACLKNNLITASNGSLVSTGVDLNHPTSAVFSSRSTLSDPVPAGSADSEMSEEQKKEKLSELRKKEQELRDILTKKTKELKKICMREAVRSWMTLPQLRLQFVSLPSLFVQPGADRQAAKGVSPLLRREATADQTTGRHLLQIRRALPLQRGLYSLGGS